MKQKLSSQRGASLVMALIFLLIAAVLSGVVLSAAGSSPSRIQSQRQSQQAYLSVSSAARLLQERLSGGSVIITQEEDGATTYQWGEDALVRSLLSPGVTARYQGGSPSPYALTLSAQGISPDAQLSLAVGADYSLALTLYALEEGSRSHTLVLRVPCSSQISYQQYPEYEDILGPDGEATGETTTTWHQRTITTLTWQPGQIEKGDGQDE